MKIALKRVTSRTRWIGKVIDALTGNRGYWHAALIIDHDWNLSSHPQHGVELREERYDAEDWDVWDIGRDDYVMRVFEFAAQEYKTGYDFLGVLRFVFPWIKEHRRRWFCSEFVVAACQKAGLFTQFDPARTSPNDLARLLGILEKVGDLLCVHKVILEKRPS